MVITTVALEMFGDDNIGGGINVVSQLDICMLVNPKLKFLILLPLSKKECNYGSSIQ